MISGRWARAGITQERGAGGWREEPRGDLGEDHAARNSEHKGPGVGVVLVRLRSRKDTREAGAQRAGGGLGESREVTIRSGRALWGAAPPGNG